jgi:hypothetical protein
MSDITTLARVLRDLDVAIPDARTVALAMSTDALRATAACRTVMQWLRARVTPQHQPPTHSLAHFLQAMHWLHAHDADDPDPDASLPRAIDPIDPTNLLTWMSTSAREPRVEFVARLQRLLGAANELELESARVVHIDRMLDAYECNIAEHARLAPPPALLFGDGASLRALEAWAERVVGYNLPLWNGGGEFTDPARIIGVLARCSRLSLASADAATAPTASEAFTRAHQVIRAACRRKRKARRARIERCLVRLANKTRHQMRAISKLYARVRKPNRRVVCR